jgi:hypothetical protein
MPKTKKRASTSRPGRSSAPPPTRWGRLKAKLKWRWINSALVVGIVVAIVGALVNHWLERPAANNSVAASPRLQVDDVLVMPKTIDHGGYGLPDFLDQVYFSLRNTGNQLAIITGVKLQVREFAQLPECVSQGGLGTTGWSSLNLPVDPSPGAVVTVPVSQQIAPDSADKFEVSLHVAGIPKGLQLYRLHAWVIYDNQVALNAGYLIISLPVEPEDGGYFWDRSLQADPSMLGAITNNVPAVSQCLISDSNKLHAILSLSGARSAKLTSLPSLLAYHY